MEIRRKVVTYKTHKICECGGELIANGVVFTVSPPLYQHICEKCKTYYTFNVKFPHLEYIEEVE